jgi:trimethyllysine dioxygenase
MFHLLSHTSGDANAAKNSEGKLGGTSLLVDGFACAEELRKSNPSAFEILSSTPINWHASGNEGITIRPSKPYPVFNLDSIGGSAGQLEQLRWNNDDRGSMVLADGPPSNPEAAQSGGILSAANSEKWFDAAAEWTQIIRAARNEYWEQLRPGRALSKLPPSPPSLIPLVP